MKLEKFFRYSTVIGIIGAVVNLTLFVTNIFYNLVVPVIENSGIEGALFKFLDDLIYYTPVIFMFLFIAYIIAGQLYLRKHRTDNEIKLRNNLVEKNDEIQKDLDEKAEYLRHKYYTNCPKCGAPGEENKDICSFCGASLIMETEKEKNKK